VIFPKKELALMAENFSSLGKEKTLPHEKIAFLNFQLGGRGDAG